MQDATEELPGQQPKPGDGTRREAAGLAPGTGSCG